MIGVEIIREALKGMPGLPGVYRMLDEAGEALYVGKARNLKNRVSNYGNPLGLTPRLQRMIEKTSRMEFTVTRTEAEALLMEANLIRSLQPRYNVLLRDDKSYPFILLADDHPYGQVVKHRGPQTRKGKYFGPFASAGDVNQSVALLQRAFLLRPCSDHVFAHRTRPCLQYQIKRCSAPCMKYISEEEYGGLMKQARDFLSGRSRDVQDQLAVEMQQASEAMEYEKAAALRDRIRALTQVQQEHGLSAAGLQEADLIALFRAGDRSCVQVFFFRGGQNFGNRAYFPVHAAEEEDANIVSTFIGQFYQARTPPRLLLVSHGLPEQALLEEALALNAPYKVEIQQPQRGDKMKLMEQGLLNAKQALERHLAERATQTQLLVALGEVLGLPSPPERIEVYDNSHISGTHAVGAMIVAGPEGFMKKYYRRYSIRSNELTPGDDYAMMREVFTRRFMRLGKEDPDRVKNSWPDLVLIDGGKGQLSIVESVLEELGIGDVNLLAIAKGPDRNAGREQFFLPGREPFSLPPHHPVLHYLQRLRDEAHRFAIGSHRIKRSNAIRQSELDQIPGIGATRKRALLLHFGSGKAVSNASLDELEKVPGISKAMAAQIYGFFRG